MKHPHPWTIKPENDRTEDLGAILDADGDKVCHFGSSAPYDNACGQPPIEPYHTLMALAPEMEDLIRSIVGKECFPGDCVECDADLQRGAPHFGDCKLNNLLTKVDIARKAAR